MGAEFCRRCSQQLPAQAGAILFLVTIAVPPVATAGPPSQLYGKSVSFSWLEDVDGIDVDGLARHAVVSEAAQSTVTFVIGAARI
jgi:hypothetical protein